jgi:hypothetical protein|nr:MAG TPA: hypothetical protein [Bacteriophage sp.]
MEDFIIFTNSCGGSVLVRKSTVVSVYEDEAGGEVIISTCDGDEFGTNDSFDSIISKLTK